MTLASTPFREIPAPHPPGFVDRLLRRPQPLRAEYELVSLLAGTPLEQITPRKVSEILSNTRLTGAEAHSLLVQIWSNALEAFLSDDALSEPELAYLTALRRLLDLGEDDIIMIENRLVHPRLHKAIAEVLSDHTVSLQEREQLARAGSALRVSPALQTHAFKKAASQLFHEMLDQSVADRRLSPTEEADLREAASNLGLDIKFEDSTQEQLRRFALLWRIENGDLPTLAVELNLAKGETCHFVCPATWYEYRKTTQTVGYSSQGVSIRIARGVYYRVGGTRPQRITTEGLVQIDSGTLYLTNKRLYFDGLRKNSSLKLHTIISFDVFFDGLAIEKGAGRSPHLVLDGDAELAATILSRLLATQ